MDRETSASHSIDSELWVDRYSDMLFRYTMARVKDPNVAEELVQITLVSALQAKDSFAGRSTEKSWLFGILKHKILDFFREQKQRNTYISPGEEDSDPYQAAYDATGHWISPPRDWETNPEKAAENKELVKALSECLEGLSDKFRNIFVLKEIEGMASEDICKEFDIQPTNLWVILHRARNQLRKCLENKEWSDKG